MKKFKHISMSLIACLPVVTCLATSVSCGKKKQIEYKQSVLDEFLGNKELQINGLVSVPRPGHYHDKIVPYLKQRVKDLVGLSDDQILVDEASNICFDIPATKGYENKDCIILQGHMDMVVAGLTEEEAKVTPIEAVIDGNTIHSKDHKTSLGADDGIGIASSLALLKNINKFKHGPLRFIFTADEDVGMIGASQVQQPWFKYNNDWIKWLINIDSEKIQQVYRSCAGNIRLSYSKDYDINQNEEQDGRKLILSIDGLLGGHSAMNIAGRANADRLAQEILWYLSSNGYGLQLISHSHPKSDGDEEKFSSNQLITHCKVEFNSRLDLSLWQGLLDGFIESWKTDYPNENWVDIKNKITLVEDTSSQPPFISSEESNKIVSLLGNYTIDPASENLEGLYYGIFKKDETGRIIASSNIGPVSIYPNTALSKITFECQSSCRSAIGNNQSDNQYTINWLGNQYRACADNAGINHNDGPIYYPWIKDDNNELVKMFVDGFKELNINANAFDTPGGVEPAWWTSISRGNTTCTCVGASIDNSHSVNETLYIDDIEPLMQNIVSVIEKIAKK